MPIAHEVIIEAQPESCASLFMYVRPLIRWLLNLPVLRHLRPFARKVGAVTEPVRRLSVQRRPGSMRREPGKSVTILSANLWHDFPKYRQYSQ